MKQGLIILTILFFLSGCCGLLCEREKHAEMIIEKVEAYREETGKLPEKVTEVDPAKNPHALILNVPYAKMLNFSITLFENGEI